MLKYVKCAICGSNSYRLICSCKITKEDADIPVPALNLVRCAACGLLLVNPQPQFSQENLQSLYSKEYYDQGYGKSADINSQASSFLSNEPFIYRLNFLENYKKSGIILDIGCTTGGFLNLASQRGWEAFGVEPSSYAYESARQNHNLNIFKGTFEESSFQDNYFDVVCASDVIEHLADPSSFLKKIYRILKPGGILYLAFPNADSSYYKFFSSIARYNQRNYFLLPYHLYHFGPSSIKLLLSKSGLNILELRYTQSKSKSFFANIFNFRDRIALIATKKTRA